MEPSLSALRNACARAATPLLFAGLAALQLRLSLVSGNMPGVSSGEGWGRLFVTAQVSRWLTGEAPLGAADLAGWPDRVPFWPTDPLVQLVQVPLRAILGDAGALTAVALLLLSLTGIGVAALARELGATPAGARVAGVVAQISPYLVRNLGDVVVEALALGPLALAMLALLRAASPEAQGRRPLVIAGLAVGALALISPYYVVYLAFLSAGVALLRPRAWRRSLGIGAACGLACALALAPMLALEGGQQGRLGPGYQGVGYQLAPGRMVLADGRPAPTGRRGGQAAPPSATPGPPAGAPDGLERLSRSWSEFTGRTPWLRPTLRLPGSGAALIGLLLALIPRRSRLYALLGLAVFAIGPGPDRLLSLAGVEIREGAGLLQQLLRRLPLTDTLGNHTRVLAPFVVLGAAIGGIGLGRRPLLWGPWLLLALVESSLHQPLLSVPATPVRAPATALAAIEGPMIVFPSGDPPMWQSGVAPKEALFLASRAGQPVAYDFGRGRTPADLSTLLTLSGVAGVALSEAGLRAARGAQDTDLRYLLVLEDRLQPRERAALRAWLETRATLLAEEAGASAWKIPEGGLVE